MAKGYSFNERVTVFKAVQVDDGMGGFSETHQAWNTFWADVQFKDSKGLDLPQYKESLQLVAILRNTPDTIQTAPDDKLYFRQTFYRVAGRKSDRETVTLTCYEANS